MTFRLFANGGGEESLGIPFFGGLFREAEPLIVASQVSNLYLLEAVRALTTLLDGTSRRSLDYRNMGAEELGSVYESLLEQHPNLNLETGAFALGTAAGSERKTTGSYYTPESLITLLLDSALDPVLDQRVEAARRDKSDVSEAILQMKVCDPACGSGHFLIAASHRIARRVAQARTGDEEPSPAAQRSALREVVARCIYGVDINPMAVELAKVSLWLEAIEPGKPLTFLDHHIKRGNSLFGATPELIDRGIPDRAFDPIEGDDRKVAASYKGRNRASRAGQQDLFAAEASADYSIALTARLALIDTMPDDTPQALAAKKASFRQFSESKEYIETRRVADGFCAAFVWPKQPGSPEPVTQSVLEGLRDGSANPSQGTREQIRELAAQYDWFHWHCEFPDVFTPAEVRPSGSATGWDGGFDCVLGNPPWDMIQLDPREYFSGTRPDIAGATHVSARKRLLGHLEAEDPTLYYQWLLDKRKNEATQHFMHSSGRFPLSSFGRLNSAPVFVELVSGLIGDAGRSGLIVPTGVATDSFTQHLFAGLVRGGQLASLWGFENEEFLFPAIHHATKFCLLTLTGPTANGGNGPMDFVFFARSIAQVREPARHFTLSVEEIARINPNTLTCPVFRSGRDAALVSRIHREVPVLAREAESGPDQGEWGFRGFLMFMMNDISSELVPLTEMGAEWSLVRSVVVEPGGGRRLPFLEAKMLSQYDHRFGTYEGQTQAQSNQGKLPELTPLEKTADRVPLPKYWLDAATVETRLGDRWTPEWFLGWRDITSAVTTRTMIASVVPRWAAANTFPLFLFGSQRAEDAALLLANLNSFALDYVARLKTGGNHLTFHIVKQLPILLPGTYDTQYPWTGSSKARDWVSERVVELMYTSIELGAFARDIGYDGPPFGWDQERRLELRCELDAAFFHFYGIGRDDVEYVMDSFWIVRSDDEKRYDEYRTKRRILELFDDYTRRSEAAT
ncbi:MAG TPA: N-6 DNA methylase [Tepidiformaceae bacterium]